MARAHLDAGYDVVASQFAVRQSFFDAVDAIVDETSSTWHHVVLIGQPEQVAARFRQRRADRTQAGQQDVSDNIADDRVDEVIAWAIVELEAVTAASAPHATVISTDGDVDSTHARVREALARRG